MRRSKRLDCCSRDLSQHKKVCIVYKPSLSFRTSLVCVPSSITRQTNPNSFFNQLKHVLFGKVGAHSSVMVDSNQMPWNAHFESKAEVLLLKRLFTYAVSMILRLKKTCADKLKLELDTTNGVSVVGNQNKLNHAGAPLLFTVSLWVA